MAAVLQTQTLPIGREAARRGIAIYLAVLIAGSAVLEAIIIKQGGLTDPTAGALVLVLMYVPAFASVVARLVGREGFEDVSFRWGGRTGTRATATAWLLPLAVAIPAYTVAWMSGLVGFAAPAGGVLASIENPVIRMVAMIGVALTVGTLFSCLSAFGEEVGWRGYLVPRLVQAKIPAPALVSTSIWCGWHVPLILWGGYATGSNPALSALLFVAAILPVGLLYAKWRMATGSVWPCVVAHGAWNVIVQSVFDPFATGPNAPTWIGESGILTVIMIWLVYLVIRGRTWAGTVGDPASL